MWEGEGLPCAFLPGLGGEGQQRRAIIDAQGRTSVIGMPGLRERPLGEASDPNLSELGRGRTSGPEDEQEGTASWEPSRHRWVGRIAQSSSEREGKGRIAGRGYTTGVG